MEGNVSVESQDGARCVYVDYEMLRNPKKISRGIVAVKIDTSLLIGMLTLGLLAGGL